MIDASVSSPSEAGRSGSNVLLKSRIPRPISPQPRPGVQQSGSSPSVQSIRQPVVVLSVTVQGKDVSSQNKVYMRTNERIKDIWKKYQHTKEFGIQSIEIV
uniref:Uncharacterized protein n=1 Tax=Daphnia galeata TaxID=27404 RepID=A0A8J2RQ68_9CRUS|nr:unnamed protein product [Daphnia galeata]